MSEQWITSWYWTWGRVHGDPPSEPQWVPLDVADALGRLADESLARDPVDKLPAFLALSHARIAQRTDVEASARVDYRVAPAVRFPDGALARGRVRGASDHVRALEHERRLASTRGPFHLSEVLAQAGLAILTARADLLEGEASPRLGTYIALAVTHSGGPLEPMRVMLFDAHARRVLTVVDDALSRAWHAPLAGGELLTLLPPFARATVSATVPRTAPSAEAGTEPRRPAATREMDSRPTVSRAGTRGRS